MASLDVESLFTNIPLEETVKNCVNYLYSNNFYSGKLSRKDLHELLKLATSESFFIFDNKLYNIVTTTQLTYLINVSKSAWTNCTFRNRLYQQYLKGNG